jgi:nucleoside-diphosphate-sugar epimerase
MSLPRLIITGASGFIGRRLLDGFKEDYNIVGLARQSQTRCGAPVHSNISWFQTDICDRESVATAFRFVRETGGADVVIHLAAHYDFSGDDHPEYWRTNVNGMRNVLEECRSLELQRFIFASSLAACRFPPVGSVLDEDSPPDGEHVYARSKRLGEEMLAEFEPEIPSAIIRFAAVYSDWCEYAPLHNFMETWLSGAWNARILGGRGDSAIPYIHARELVPFISQVIRLDERLDRRQILIASPSHTVSHEELFDVVARESGAELKPPIHMPAALARIGVWARDALGRLFGERPFERPWMVAYIDEALSVDPSRSWALLDWRPRRRLYLKRRMTFLLDHRKTDPLEWALRNQAAQKRVHLRPSLRVHNLVEKHQDAIRRRFLTEVMESSDSADRFPSTSEISPQVLAWRFTVAFRHILNSIRAEDRGLFLGYCRDFAEKRFADGVSPGELIELFRVLNDTTLSVVREDPGAVELEGGIFDYWTMTIEYGCDQVLEVYEDLSGAIIGEEMRAQP